MRTLLLSLALTLAACGEPTPTYAHTGVYALSWSVTGTTCPSLPEIPRTLRVDGKHFTLGEARGDVTVEGDSLTIAPFDLAGLHFGEFVVDFDGEGMVAYVMALGPDGCVAFFGVQGERVTVSSRGEAPSPLVHP